MSQSAELAGGEGFTYEGNVAAFYLSALLAEAHAPGIDNRIVTQVSVQQRNFGEPLDDVIVDFEDISKTLARLSLQVKRSLTISKAATNKDFREIIRDSWSTLNKTDFRIHIDRYGAAVGTIAPAKERALITICEWARDSQTADHFRARFDDDGSASKSIKAVWNDVVDLLEENKGMQCTSKDVHQFFMHFVLIRFDFLHEGATEPPEAINRIGYCLVPEDAHKASLVWSRAVQLVRESSGKSGQFDRARFVRLISSVARLRGATSLRADLEKLTELAKSYINLIQDDVGGARLDRASLLDKLDTKLSIARAVQIRGLPGSGKSVVLRRAVQRALENGPAFFLKAEQLVGTSWISYANSHGLSCASLEQILVEVGVTGTPILFIDAIDRVEKEHQPIIQDVIRVIVESPLLDNWSIAVSLRDTGIEVLRNWLGGVLDILKVETLVVGQLNDEEAIVLANAKPHLRPLLFGTAQIQEIVRRPFFAKVLNQGYTGDPTAPIFAPQSEVDLIENWWRRGGYNEVGQSAIERQRALLDLARVSASQLSQPIRLTRLNSVAHINGLVSDGILQYTHEGISVRFAHDIFFEWAFFYVLIDRGTEWIEEIKACGEPPAVARVVELASQWAYEQGNIWSSLLAQTESLDLRSQWLRAWLVGPLGTVKFLGNEGQYTTTIYADDFRLFRKVLVWFQAEKTSPNVNILTGDLPQEKRQRLADYFGWPSDFSTWRRLIDFILQRISDIPQRLYPEIIAIFEVWQNAFANYSNPTSHALLQQCATWLKDINTISIADGPDEKSTYWGKVSDLGAFRKSMSLLLLNSSKSEPSFASDYIQSVINSERIQEGMVHDILVYSPILSQSVPRLLVELMLVFHRGELPDDRVAREKQEFHDQVEWRKTVSAKPEAERTRQENMALTNGFFSLRPIGEFTHYDWDRLSIRDGHSSFYPPSPLREPFYSLFKSSPNDALEVFRKLCNHAITAWQQLHRHSTECGGTPIPLELNFPWGTQQFWGGDREYLWFRSMWAPDVIGCGFMALEEWCFAELDRGRPLDQLIQQIVERNECIAILGVASMLALHTETVSEVTLPLFTSQRLLAADHNRWAQDISQTSNLIGFTSPSDKPHIEAVKVANEREVRKKELQWMVPMFFFSPGPISELARDAILGFKDNLPYKYDEDQNNLQIQEALTAQALEYAELVERENYRLYRDTEENTEQINIVHVSPSDEKPEKVLRAKEASRQLKQVSLWTWASKSFEKQLLDDACTIDDAIQLAKEADESNLFKFSKDESEEELLAMRRGAVAATAAIVLKFREGRTQEELEWARDVLGRAILLPEKPDLMWSTYSHIPWHQAIYVARGLAADLYIGTAMQDTASNLLSLVAHPLRIVSLEALKEVCKLWPNEPRLVWAALILAFTLCQVPRRPRHNTQQHDKLHHMQNEKQNAIDAAYAFYEKGSDWDAIPLPPPAWVKVEPGKGFHKHQMFMEYIDPDEATDLAEEWGEPDVHWDSKLAAGIFQQIPIEAILSSDARGAFLDFLAEVLNWTIEKNSPPWDNSERRHHRTSETLEWTRSLGSSLGLVAGLIPLSDFQSRFLDPILEIKGENCWAFLTPFSSTYICAYVYDATAIPSDAVAILDLCLGRFLQDPVFSRNTYRSGEFYGFNQPELVHILMFVEIEHAGSATRYVNGDWSEINHILPLIDRFVRTGGWAASVMGSFLTLCERARDSYPAEVFADQVLSILSDQPENLKGWRNTFIPARIAEMVQHFAYRDAPLDLVLGQKLLRILDILIDMGDRRSAALQLSETFRNIRLSS